ncbi:tumor necrosis factor receptor superfamily member 8-like [Hyperolius riggenbachi]|uniref:tumor necrosis factor receptor superfamily member 8-like n=1 Tax=Hyperolius riggenbachi TaxID=752182 RepID=UPI0035A3623A
MNDYRLLLLALIALVTCQVSAGLRTCPGNGYYSETAGQCCQHCPKGLVKCDGCVQNAEKQCAESCNPGQFIDWESQHRECRSCNKCGKELFLVEVQACSMCSNAICACQTGYYCHSPASNERTCLRCEPHTACPTGQGVSQPGTKTQDTKCQECPPDTFSDISSTTERCKNHTDCGTLQKVTVRRGTRTADALCKDFAPPLLIGMKPSGVRPGEDRISITPGVQHESPAPNPPLPPPTTKDGADIRETTAQTSECGECPPGTYCDSSPAAEKCRKYTDCEKLQKSTVRKGTRTTDAVCGNKSSSGKLTGLYVLAGIICVITLLIAFATALRRKLCHLKLWLKNKRNFAPQEPKTSNMLITYEEESNESVLLQRQNSAESHMVFLESCHKSEEAQNQQEADGRPETQQGRDQLNNRIEKIYIMNADTVFVGSISEAPNRPLRPVAVDGERRGSSALPSRYPEQESSKVTGSDLMLSVEEEEREDYTAKDTLQV